MRKTGLMNTVMRDPTNTAMRDLTSTAMLDLTSTATITLRLEAMMGGAALPSNIDTITRAPPPAATMVFSRGRLIAIVPARSTAALTSG